MLTIGDISFIQQAREEIRINRMRSVELIFKVIEGKHPVTEEPIEKTEVVEVDAVVTVISTDRILRKYMELGMEYRTGDIIVDVSIGDLPDEFDYTKLDSVIYLGESFIDVAPIMLGMGKFNRYEFLCRREV